MERYLECLLKDLSLEQLMQSSSRDTSQKAMQVFQAIRNHYFAFAEKRDELGMTGIKAVTVATFAILKKIANGKMPSELDAQDWGEIASTVSEYAVLESDKHYSISIFGLYERYIRYSVTAISSIVPEKSIKAISRLADELHRKAISLKEGHISEVAYTEDCLWISLEAMIKLLACTAVLAGDERAAECAQAFASYAFEYGRLRVYSRELELVNQYIASQYELDAELEHKYTGYLNDLRKESEQFYTLIYNAFANNFRDAFLHSIILARAVGVSEEDLLTNSASVDSFFLE